MAENKALRLPARGLQAITVLIALGVIVVLVGPVPELLGTQGKEFPEFAHLTVPGYAVFSVITGVSLAALAAFWLVCGRLAKGEVCSARNRRALWLVALCMGANIALAAGLGLALLVAGAINPGVLLAGSGLCTLCAGVGLAATVLGRLAQPAQQ